MEKQQIRFGFDRCPATKNMVGLIHCRDCDFKEACNSQQCRCNFQAYTKELQVPATRKERTNHFP